MQGKTVVVTGASGLLGRAVGEYFVSKGDRVVPLAFTRAAVDPSYTKLDLMDVEAVEGFFQRNVIDVVVHCAAERRPDVAEANPEKAARINVQVPAHLAELARTRGFVLIYISTDYVFNGSKPPYEVDDEPDPLQMYGNQKRSGELAVLAERSKGAKVTVLRLPLLYGQTTYNAESAVNVLVDVIQDQSGKQYKMDDYQVRYPTNVEDVARVIFELCHINKSLPGILHYSSTAPPLTKYGMTKIIAKHLSQPIDHVIPDSTKPPEPLPGQTRRPENTQLSVKALDDLGISTTEAESFDHWWGSYIAQKRG